ncbi:MAG: thiamine pyrophosphate-dependent dehydrogenase E1 component subunit alpha [Magnetovibrionaceae bacterium]
MTQPTPLALYYSMRLIRDLEETIAERYGEQEMRCPVHLSVGQEAAAVGSCAALNADDLIVSTHRCHGHYLAKGGDPRAMMAEIYGRVTGCCGGRGGSMHLFDEDAGVLASVPIVGSALPLGVGAALAIQQRGEDRVVVGFVGDGAVEEGAVHEAANFAALKKLPMIFFVENNQFSVYTDVADRQPTRPLTNLGRAHGMPSERCDGNDVEQTLDVTMDAIERARAGDGPSWIVADTYRWREHCGPNYDNDLGYRTEADFLEWKARDPLPAFETRLREEGAARQAELDDIGADVAKVIEDAFDFALSSPMPDPASIGDHLHAG